MPVTYNDVEFCLRLGEAGYYNVVKNALSKVGHFIMRSHITET